VRIRQATRSALAALAPVLASGLASAMPAQAAAYVLGDSHGVAFAQVSHLKNLARISVHIRGPRALEQFAQTPANSTVFLVLGTNDANGSIARLDKSIDDILRAAEKKNITMVWIGPPCVRLSWDSRARELDTMLRTRLANTSVRYVSMRDQELCSGGLHEPDGVHLKMKGYAYMWAKTRLAAADAVAGVIPAIPSGAAIEHTSAVNKTTVEKIPLPPRRPRRTQP
jgi:lysophospholipase L1-like esterase